jgi:hypothetical protein
MRPKEINGDKGMLLKQTNALSRGQEVEGKSQKNT